MNTMTSKSKIERILLTPERAMELLNHNTLNRPLSDSHVARLAHQMKTGAWIFNGDTIKVSDDGNIVDGQHRCWGCVESKTPIETIIVYGVPRAAFATVDTLRKPRNAADILSLNGVTNHRREAGVALTWLVRWQRKPPTFKGSASRVENSEIEHAFAHHHNILQATERMNVSSRGIASPGLNSFLYYILSNRDPELGERFAMLMERPAGVSISDPFFRFRSYLTADRVRARQPIMTIALFIKAANAAKAGKKIESLAWRNSGKTPEPFPKIAF